MPSCLWSEKMPKNMKAGKPAKRAYKADKKAGVTPMVGGGKRMKKK